MQILERLRFPPLLLKFLPLRSRLMIHSRLLMGKLPAVKKLRKPQMVMLRRVQRPPMKSLTMKK